MGKEEPELIKGKAGQEEMLRLADKISSYNKRVDDDYDEKMKRLDDKKKLVPNRESAEKNAEKIELLTEKYNELKEKISEARRIGKDPLLADFMIRNVKSKIKLAEITEMPEDFIRVENILKRANKELDEALKQEELDIKKEIEEKLKESLGKKAEVQEDNKTKTSA